MTAGAAPSTERGQMVGTGTSSTQMGWIMRRRACSCAQRTAAQTARRVRHLASFLHISANTLRARLPAPERVSALRLYDGFSGF